jgi:hypothetical protein
LPKEIKMSYVWQPVRALAACILVAIFTVPPSLLAQSHLVSPADLQKELVAGTQVRQHNLETVRQLLSSERAENALKSAHINPVQVQTAVATLSDQELAQLASRADKAQADFAGGRLEDRDLLIIIVAIAALVLLIVAVR